MKNDHDGDFENLRADRDAALAVAVREISAGHRKQNEGQREKASDDKH